jgi:hypothetical protein
MRCCEKCPETFWVLAIQAPPDAHAFSQSQARSSGVSKSLFGSGLGITTSAEKLLMEETEMPSVQRPEAKRGLQPFVSCGLDS